MRLSRSAWISALFFLALPSLAQDYSAASRQARVLNPYVDDRVVRLAIGLARATNTISADDVKKMVNAIDKKQDMPKELINEWQKLLRLAQIQVYQEALPRFYSVGYEFETAKVGKRAYDDFKQGAEKYSSLIAGSFGADRTTVFTEKGRVRDGSGRVWSIVTEWTREGEPAKDGWEIVSPPSRTPEALQEMAAFRWNLGASSWGHSNKMTGLHQTTEMIPVGAQADSKLMGKVAANLLLLQAQYGPAMFEVLGVKRFGGPENLFLRPFVFDHGELLEDLRTTDPSKLDLKALWKKMFVDHLDTEFVAQLKNNYDSMDDPEVKEMLKWTQEQRQKWRPLYKYRDSQIKFNLDHPEKSLFEVRIGDYVSDKPEVTMLQTLLQQMLLDKAYTLAKEGKLWDLKVPKREPGETDIHYWGRLQMNPDATPESMLHTLGVKDVNLANLVLGRKFDITSPGFRAGEKEGFGFEIEGWSEKLADIVLPRDPKLRAQWADMGHKARVKEMARLGFEFDGTYSRGKHIALTSQFYCDIDRFPWMDPELHLEASGNWEVKSSRRGFGSLDEMKEKISHVAHFLREKGTQFGGIHMHDFIPDDAIAPSLRPAAKPGEKAPLMTEQKASEFADMLERQSAYMALQGYAESDTHEPSHGLDSWSLDRYSPKDLEQVQGHMQGTRKVAGVDQKYHNIAFRPVEGGIDIEARDVGDDIEYGITQLRRVSAGLTTGNMGGIGLHDDPPLFMEFKDHIPGKVDTTALSNNAAGQVPDVTRYTLEDAVARNYTLTATERALLHKMQFEIYKPSMGEYFHFDHFTGLDEARSHEMDTKMIRTNFENNVAIPLLNWEEQSYLSAADKATLAANRKVFIDRVHALMQAIEKDPKYQFLTEHDDFLYLADYLNRSTHPSKPDLNLVSEKVGGKQRELLEDLTYKLRSLVVKYVKATQVNQMVEKSLPSAVTAAQRGGKCNVAGAGTRIAEGLIR